MKELELYLFGQRWYDSSVGRFISRDPIVSPLLIHNRMRAPSITNMLFVYNKGINNLYIYADNNPLHFLDSTGLGWPELCRFICTSACGWACYELCVGITGGIGMIPCVITCAGVCATICDNICPPSCP